MATKTYKIYRCINNVNGKVYIGYAHKPLEWALRKALGT